MRASLLPVMLVAALTACGEARNSDTAEASEMPRLVGHYKAASANARAITGDVGIERGGLIFSRGQVLYTRTLEGRRGGEMTAQGGDSYAAIALGPSNLRVELRRVTDATSAAGLCPGATPAYIALVHEEFPSGVTLLVFSGAEPPGPQATRSQLCASFAYQAPHGARTREGVVLR